MFSIHKYQAISTHPMQAMEYCILVNWEIHTPNTAIARMLHRNGKFKTEKFCSETTLLVNFYMNINNLTVFDAST